MAERVPPRPKIRPFPTPKQHSLRPCGVSGVAPSWSTRRFMPPPPPTPPTLPQSVSAEYTPMQRPPPNTTELSRTKSADPASYDAVVSPIVQGADPTRFHFHTDLPLVPPYCLKQRVYISTNATQKLPFISPPESPFSSSSPPRPSSSPPSTSPMSSSYAHSSSSPTNPPQRAQASPPSQSPSPSPEPAAAPRPRQPRPPPSPPRANLSSQLLNPRAADGVRGPPRGPPQPPPPRSMSPASASSPVSTLGQSLGPRHPPAPPPASSHRAKSPASASSPVSTLGQSLGPRHPPAPPPASSHRAKFESQPHMSVPRRPPAPPPRRSKFSSEPAMLPTTAPSPRRPDPTRPSRPRLPPPAAAAPPLPPSPPPPSAAAPSGWPASAVGMKAAPEAFSTAVDASSPASSRPGDSSRPVPSVRPRPRPRPRSGSRNFSQSLFPSSGPVVVPRRRPSPPTNPAVPVPRRNATQPPPPVPTRSSSIATTTTTTTTRARIRVGGRPLAAPAASLDDDLATLERQLQDAVSNRQFERCTELRDRIQKAKGRPGTADSSSIAIDQRRLHSARERIESQLEQAIQLQQFEECVSLRDTSARLDELVLSFEHETATFKRRNALAALNKLIDSLVQEKFS